MNRNERIISSLPVEELWAGQRLVSTIKVRDLGSSEMTDLLRSSAVRFVIADVGKPLVWVPNNEGFDLWKDELKSHLAAPESRPTLEEFPDNYCYFASEWKAYDGDTIILLSKAH